MCAIPRRGVIPGGRFRKLSRAYFDEKSTRTANTGRHAFIGFSFGFLLKCTHFRARGPFVKGAKLKPLVFSQVTHGFMERFSGPTMVGPEKRSHYPLPFFHPLPFFVPSFLPSLHYWGNLRFRGCTSQAHCFSGPANLCISAMVEIHKFAGTPKQSS